VKIEKNQDSGSDFDDDDDPDKTEVPGNYNGMIPVLPRPVPLAVHGFFLTRERFLTVSLILFCLLVVVSCEFK